MDKFDKSYCVQTGRWCEPDATVRGLRSLDNGPRAKLDDPKGCIKDNPVLKKCGILVPYTSGEVLE